MLTVVRCTRAVGWTLVTGLRAFVSGVEEQLWEGRDTVPGPRALLWTLVANAGGSQSSRGMEYCLKHSLACSQAMGVEHMVVAARARQATQGTSRASHDGDDLVYAAVRHTHSVALSAVWVPCCQTLSVEKWKVRTAGANTADLSGAGCRHWSAGGVFRRERLISAGRGRGVEAGQSGWKAVG